MYYTYMRCAFSYYNNFTSSISSFGDLPRRSCGGNHRNHTCLLVSAKLLRSGLLFTFFLAGLRLPRPTPFKSAWRPP